MKPKIVGVQELDYGQLEVDEWVPFTFRAYKNRTAEPFYWTIGDHKTSLLEMKIDATSGVVLAVLLTACQRFDAGERLSIPERLPEVVGLPVVTLDGFEHGRYRELSDLCLYELKNSFFVVVDGAPQPDRCIKFDRVAVFEGRGEICAVRFFDLTQTEVQIIHNWKSYQKKDGVA